jgi:hypothetical protein
MYVGGFNDFIILLLKNESNPLHFFQSHSIFVGIKILEDHAFVNHGYDALELNYSSQNSYPEGFWEVWQKYAFTGHS